MSEENFSMPRINEPAPAFEARTTDGVKKTERLSRKVAGIIFAPCRLHSSLYH